MKTSYEESVRSRRLASVVAGLTALLALTLACLGIFSVVAYGVALRTREIGIRRALGATGASVIALVLRQLTFPVGAGLLLGTCAGVAIGWFFARAPFYLPSNNLMTTVLVVASFAVAAAAVALLPASRALGAEPIKALRHE